MSWEEAARALTPCFLWHISPGLMGFAAGTLPSVAAHWLPTGVCLPPFLDRSISPHAADSAHLGHRDRVVDRVSLCASLRRK